MSDRANKCEILSKNTDLPLPLRLQGSKAIGVIYGMNNTVWHDIVSKWIKCEWVKIEKKRQQKKKKEENKCNTTTTTTLEKNLNKLSQNVYATLHRLFLVR